MAKKKNNSSKYIKFVVAVVLVIAVVFGIYYLFLDKNDTKENETISRTQSVSVSETISSSKPKETEKQTSESTSAVTVSSAANPNTTTKQAKNYELPLSINQALNALEEHYGSEYNINATIEEDGINYFALYKDDEKYASITVNLSTGEATETIMETNQKTDFYLV